MLRSAIAPEPWPYLNSGSKVLIERGPLVGLEAIVIQSLNHWRVVVSVELLQRSVATEIDRAWVRELQPQLSLGPGADLAGRGRYANATEYNDPTRLAPNASFRNRNRQ